MSLLAGLQLAYISYERREAFQLRGNTPRHTGLDIFANVLNSHNCKIVISDQFTMDLPTTSRGSTNVCVGNI